MSPQFALPLVILMDDNDNDHDDADDDDDGDMNDDDDDDMNDENEIGHKYRVWRLVHTMGGWEV